MMILPLKTWRVIRGWTQTQLAAQAGVTPLTLRRMESLTGGFNRPEVWFKVAQALGIHPLQILEFRRAFGIPEDMEFDLPDADRKEG